MHQSFDIATYSRQCNAIAQAYKDWSNASISYGQYEAVQASNPMVEQKAVQKIERTVILMGSKFRPIDAVQF